VDCSFISAGLVLSCLPPLLDARADVVVLVKPQFELGPDRVGKRGIVRDPVARDEAVATVARRAEELGLRVAGRVASPIAGKGGNLETFLWLTR
jgi:23S rRNA (cytidine1920-2'-O)/16S rRNA (cytidine1409-2'-O)-methyltransferase